MKVKTLVYLNGEVKKKAQVLCIENGESLSGLVNRLLESYTDIKILEKGIK